MKPEDIHPWDWQRIMIGEVPPVFLLEVILRMAFVYLLLMLSMRLLGKRMAAQLTRNELSAMVSLAAAIGSPIISPDRGLLPPVVIVIVVVSISRLVAYISSINQKIESVTQGTLDTLITDSVMNMESMVKTRLTRERIMAQLRCESILHLGEIKRLYLEANGNFSVVRSDNPQPGLAVIPDGDPEFLHQLRKENILVCHVCGQKNRSQNASEKCSNCNHTAWVNAVR
jgi:uncharacterized membrane protein YcaP (DUF421 family)